jgi:dTDP-4-amino-4,6-dideoxy-D-galactose acyltransferase
MIPGVDIQHLAWDSDWLGLPVARVVGEGLNDPARLAAVLAQCQTAGVKLLYLVLNPTQQQAAVAVQVVGAQLVDSKHVYQQRVEANNFPTAPSHNVLFQAETLTPTLQQLAVQSGEYSRFRLDKRIGLPAFEALYTNWLHRSLLQGQVWGMATHAGTVGLLAFASHEHYASIELLAVAATARRQGTGKCLVQLAQQLAYRQGCDMLQVVTQGLNQPARRLYERCGFQLARTEHIYHLWL